MGAKIVFDINKKSLQQIGIDPDQAAKDFYEYQAREKLYLLAHLKCIRKMNRALEITSSPATFARKQGNL